MKSLAVALLAIAVTACASSRGFDRGALRSEITDQAVVTEDDIKRALAARPQLPRPFKLAIHCAPPKVPERRYGDSWKWLGDDKQKLLEMGAELKARGVVSEVLLLGEAIVEGSDNKAIRLAAAQAGADAVLILKGIADVDSHLNAWSFTYLLLVTIYFVPAVDLDSVFLASASMWDVRNQFLYLSVETEGTAKEARSLMLAHVRDRVIKAAKSAAVAAMADELSARLASMDGK